jgi:hypothetical protein
MKTHLSSLQRNQTFLRIMIFTLVTVIIWVGITLFKTQNDTGISPKELRLAVPLNPNINVDVLTRIEQKRTFSQAELSDFPIYSIVTSKTGEEELIIFNASDKSKQSTKTQSINPNGAAAVTSPAPAAGSSGSEGSANPEGSSTVTPASGTGSQSESGTQPDAGSQGTGTVTTTPTSTGSDAPPLIPAGPLGTQLDSPTGQ